MISSAGSYKHFKVIGQLFDFIALVVVWEGKLITIITRKVFKAHEVNFMGNYLINKLELELQNRYASGKFSLWKLSLSLRFEADNRIRVASST